MTIYSEKRGGRLTGVYIIEVSGVRKRHRDLGQARIIEASLRAGVDMSGPDNDEKPYTLRDLTRDSRGRFAGKRTAADIEAMWDECVEILGPETPVVDLRTPQLDKLVATLRKRTSRRTGEALSGSSINQRLAAVSGALRWAWTRDHIAGVPAIPWQAVGDPRNDTVSHDDEQRVIAHLMDKGKTREALAVEVLAATGLRARELTTLTSSDLRVDADTGWITVRAEVSKTGKARHVPLPTELAARLGRALLAGEMPGYWGLYKAFKSACRALGLKDTVCLHTLRHTTGTRLNDEGVPSLTIQDFLGHSDVRTTRGYVHTGGEALAKAAKRLQKARVAG